MASGSDLVTRVVDLYDGLDATTHQALILRHLNGAQDLMEAFISEIPRVLGTWDDGTFTADQFWSDIPTGDNGEEFLRIDRVTFVEADGDERPLDPIREPGKIRSGPTSAFPVASAVLRGRVGGEGEPTAYSVYGSRLLWDNTPQAADTFRVWGFQEADDLTAGGTFAYQNNLIYPVCAIAARMAKLQVDEDDARIRRFAQELLSGPLEQIRKKWRDGPSLPRYSRSHRA